MTRFYLAATAITLMTAGTGSASPATLEALLQGQDLSLSWQGETIRDDVTVLHAPVMTGTRLRITADRLAHDEASGAIVFTAGHIHDVSAPESGARVAFSEISFASADMLNVLSIDTLCQVFPGPVPVTGRVAFDDLMITPIHGQITLPGERVTMGRGALALTVASDLSCMRIDRLSLSGVQLTGADRSIVALDDVTMEVVQESADAADMDLALGRVSAFDPDGRFVGAIERVTSSWQMRNIEPLTGQEGTEIIIERLMDLEINMMTRVDGLFIEADDPHLATALAGHFQVDLQQGGGEIDLAVDMDIRGLMRTSIDLGLTILPAGQALGLSQLIGDAPGLAYAERLALRRLAFSAEDRGSLTIMESVTGRSEAELMTRLRGLLSSMPSVVATPVAAFMEAVLRGGAGFTAQPDAPVSLPQAVMTAMLQPDRLGALLAIREAP